MLHEHLEEMQKMSVAKGAHGYLVITVVHDGNRSFELATAANAPASDGSPDHQALANMLEQGFQALGRFLGSVAPNLPEEMLRNLAGDNAVAGFQSGVQAKNDN